MTKRGAKVEKGYKRLMVEAHRRSARHQRSSFHESGSSLTFLKDAIPDFADELQYFLFHFNRQTCRFVF